MFEDTSPEFLCGLDLVFQLRYVETETQRPCVTLR